MTTLTPTDAHTTDARTPGDRFTDAGDRAIKGLPGRTVQYKIL